MDFKEQLKIRVRESTKAQASHLIVKSLISLLIKIKYQRKINHQEIYSEYCLEEGKITDICHINNLTKQVFCYEVQSEINSKWIEDTNDFYSSIKKFKDYTVDWILVDLNKTPSDIDKLVKYLESSVVI